MKFKFKFVVFFSLALMAVMSAIYYVRYAPKPYTSIPEPTPAFAFVLATQNKQFTLPILVYHYVEIVTDQRDTIRKSLNITPSTFERQVQTLKENGYTFITPSQIPQIQSGKLNVEKPIIISFDDGYHDFYTDVFPILKKENIRVIAYIVPGFLDKPNYMYWDQLEEIVKSNLVEIGAHTVSHPALDKLQGQIASAEIVQSKSLLEQRLGIKVNSFAYPYGRFNDQVVKIVQSAGYISAVTEIPGPNQSEQQPFVLKRIHPGVAIGQALITKLK